MKDRKRKMSSYENALRSMARDAQAICEAWLEGKLYSQHAGQVRVLVKDIDLLCNRENCPNYGYTKTAGEGDD